MEGCKRDGAASADPAERTQTPMAGLPTFRRKLAGMPQGAQWIPKGGQGNREGKGDQKGKDSGKGKGKQDEQWEVQV